MASVRPIRWSSSRVLALALLTAEIVTGAVVVKHWAYVSTHRFYLDRRLDASAASTAAERFELEHDRVAPQIVAHDERVTFPVAIGGSSTILAELRPIGSASFAIAMHDGGRERVLASGTTSTPVAIAVRLPEDDVQLSFTTTGNATWIDPRLQRDFQGRRALAVLFGLIGGSILLARYRPLPPLRDRTRRAVVLSVATMASVTFGVVLLEVSLRAMGPLWSRSLGAVRHDLGELTPDTRWEESPRYGMRLRARVDAINQWRDGDIVRMGFIPPANDNPPLHRFHFRTDAEGFRNAAVRDPIDIAVLGDSFTDAMTVASDASWPVLLERRLGEGVQNYGTAGFGPQQELMVLNDFALRHRPSIVVLAFFAGNDIFDAEAFDRFERSHGALTRVAPGWPIKEVVTRADTWYVTSAIHALTASFRSPKAEADAPAEHLAALSRGDAPRFEHGRFFLDVNGHALQLALMPPYLNLLRFSEAYLESRPGWALTQRAITDMRDATRRADAEFIVMFLPFKSQIALPMLERRYSREQLDAAFRSSLPGPPAPPSLEIMDQNRLAQNRMMRRLCDELGVPLLDMTEPLQARFEQGENVYFPDDSHINETGHGVVADALATFIASNRTVASRR
jgi:lysophospholipase L1-like esterase